MNCERRVQARVSLTAFLWLPNGARQRVDQEVVHCAEQAFDNPFHIGAIRTGVRDANAQGIYEIRSAVTFEFPAIAENRLRQAHARPFLSGNFDTELSAVGYLVHRRVLQGESSGKETRILQS